MLCLFMTFHFLDYFNFLIAGLGGFRQKYPGKLSYIFARLASDVKGREHYISVTLKIIFKGDVSDSVTD